jgi:hypothetical protein
MPESDNLNINIGL